MLVAFLFILFIAIRDTYKAFFKDRKKQNGKESK